VFTHLSGNVCGYDVAVFQLYAKHGVGQGIDNPALHFNVIFFCQALTLRIVSLKDHFDRLMMRVQAKTRCFSRSM
jgi:hypothetical protein